MILDNYKYIESFFSKGNILFLGCHLDDIEYGCGGLISQLVDSGFKDNITYLTLSRFNKSANGEITVERDLYEAYAAISYLGIAKGNVIINEIPGQLFQTQAQEIRELLLDIHGKLNPAFVFFPSKNDIHQDHQTLCDEAIRIFRNTNCFGYELIRSCYHFQPNVYIEISESNIEKKINAVMCYKSQLTQSAGYYFNQDVIKSVSIFRGGQCGKKLAEAYELYFYQL